MKRSRGSSFFLTLFSSVLFFVCTPATSTFASNDPRLSIDNNGNIAAAWLTYVGDSCAVKASFKLQNSNWTYPHVISSANVNTSEPKIYAFANNTDISIVVIWTQTSVDGITGLYAAMLPSSVDSWTSPVMISASNENVSSPQFDLVIDPLGNSTAVWVSEISGSTWISAAAAVGFTNTWSAPLSQQP